MYMTENYSLMMFDVDWCTHSFHSIPFHSIPFRSIHFQYSSVPFSSIQLSSIQSVILSLHSVIRFKTSHLNSSVFTRFTRSIQTISCHSFSQLLASILFNSVSFNSSIHSCSFNFWGCSTSLWVIQAGPDNAKLAFPIVRRLFAIVTFLFWNFRSCLMRALLVYIVDIDIYIHT